MTAFQKATTGYFLHSEMITRTAVSEAFSALRGRCCISRYPDYTALQDKECLEKLHSWENHNTEILLDQKINKKTALFMHHANGSNADISDGPPLHLETKVLQYN